MDKYTIYCTEEQTKKSLKLGASIEYHKLSEMVGISEQVIENDSIYYNTPTAEQLIGWLEEQEIFISIIPDTDESTCANYVETKESSMCNTVHSSRKEAILAAIDTALDYLDNDMNNE